jgi:molybdopterin biosynthesis enzyme
MMRKGGAAGRLRVPPLTDRDMPSLTPLADCLAQALTGLAPVAVAQVPPAQGVGAVLAADLLFPADLPPQAVALRAGFAVAALDLMGACADMPLPAGPAVPVVPGQPLPPGCDAVLDGSELDWQGGLALALRAPAPGEGVRLAGHDARAGAPIAQAGAGLSAQSALVAGLAGLDAVPVRRPRVALDGVPQPGFIAHWVQAMGGAVGNDAPDLILRTAADHAPRLALAPGGSAWLARHGHALMLDLPPRFDAMLAALLALGGPVMAALSGRVEPLRPLRLSRKLTSAIGLTEVVLLTPTPAGWLPEPALTLSAMARARAFALIPPGSEGHPVGDTIPALPLAEALP